MDDLERQRELRQLRDETLNTPNCPKCLTRMEPAEVNEDVVWHCPECNSHRKPERR